MASLRLVLLSVGLAVSGSSCEAPAHTPASEKQKAAPLPRVISSATGEWAGGWGKGLSLQYETSLDPTDVAKLRVEAESIWTAHRAAAEAGGVCTVQLKASEPERRVLHVPGTEKSFFTRRNFSFLLRRDAPGGEWRWLTSDVLPATVCPP